MGADAWGGRGGGGGVPVWLSRAAAGARRWQGRRESTAVLAAPRSLACCCAAMASRAAATGSSARSSMHSWGVGRVQEWWAEGGTSEWPGMRGHHLVHNAAREWPAVRPSTIPPLPHQKRHAAGAGRVCVGGGLHVPRCGQSCAGVGGVIGRVCAVGRSRLGGGEGGPAALQARAGGGPPLHCPSSWTPHLSGSASHSATSSGDSMMYFCVHTGVEGRWVEGGEYSGNSEMCIRGGVHREGARPSDSIAAHPLPHPPPPLPAPPPPTLHNGLHQLRALRGRQQRVQRVCRR